MSGRSSLVFIVFVVVALAIPLFILLGVDAQFRLYFSNVAQTASAMACGVICLATTGAFPAGSPLRKAWALIGAGVILWGVGSAIFAGYPVINAGEETPYPYYSDLFFLLTSPLIALGLFEFKRSTKLVAPLWGIALALVLLFSMGYWCFLANSDGLSGDLPTVLTAVGYMLFDPILLATTVLVASSFRGGAVGRSWWLVVTGVALYFWANQVYSYLASTEQYQTGSATDAFWVLGFGFIAWAGLTTKNLMR